MRPTTPIIDFSRLSGHLGYRDQPGHPDFDVLANVNYHYYFRLYSRLIKTFRLILGILVGSRLMAHGRERPARPAWPEGARRVPSRGPGQALHLATRVEPAALELLHSIWAPRTILDLSALAFSICKTFGIFSRSMANEQTFQQLSRGSIRHLGKNLDLGSARVQGGIFFVNCDKSVAQSSVVLFCSALD